jgi:hypothetical protein
MLPYKDTIKLALKNDSNRIYYFALLLMASLLFNTAMADEQEKDAETLRLKQNSEIDHK